MIKEFTSINRVNGELILPGDKSISHRAVMFGSMADGVSVIGNLSTSEDVKSTMNCFKELGCEFEIGESTIKIKGKGFKGFNKPKKSLDCGNSGTTARLISGILAAQDFETELIGDESLSKRPMMRIVEPLRKMNAKIFTSDKGTLPIKINPSALNPINYEMTVASAQVKSSILLAGLHLVDETIVTEKVFTRNHTEKMLGLKTVDTGNGVSIYSSKKKYPIHFQINVPSDISTASFFIVLTLLLPDSELVLKNVSLNPTRTGVLRVLKNMSGDIQILNKRSEMNEETGDILVRSSRLKNVEIDKSIIPNIIDEIPVISVAGIFAEGNFQINNAEELRYKECDRISALCENYKKLGLKVDEFNDGFSLSGGISSKNVLFESFGDHRIAMTFAVLSSLLKSGGRVEDFDCVKISNPDFLGQLRSISF